MSDGLRLERVVAIAAALVLAGAGAVMVESVEEWPFRLLVSPPLLMGLGAAGLAAARGPRGQRLGNLVVRATLVAAATAYALIGVLLIVPGLIIGLVAFAFLGFSASGPAEARRARTLVATGTLWAIFFGLVAYLGHAPPSVHVALAASLALGLAGLAWLRELGHGWHRDVLPPRAVARS